LLQKLIILFVSVTGVRAIVICSVAGVIVRVIVGIVAEIIIVFVAFSVHFVIHFVIYTVLHIVLLIGFVSHFLFLRFFCPQSFKVNIVCTKELKTILCNCVLKLVLAS